MVKKKKDDDITSTETTAPEQALPEETVLESSNEELLTELRSQLDSAQAEAARNQDNYLRAVAELDNYRKRAQREKEELAKFANERLLRELLPVVDNLERALEHAGKDSGNGSSLLTGVEMTLGQLAKVLENFGVTPVSALGTPFDSARHEAMGQLETSEHPPNTVAQQLQKGYLLNERLLRPALVMIAKAPVAG